MNEEMNSDLSEESSQDNIETNRENLDEGDPLPMTASKFLSSFDFEKLMYNSLGGESIGHPRNGNRITEKNESLAYKKRKASQNQTKLSKTIQNNIDMYFKRDFTKLKTSKEVQPAIKKSLVEKKAGQSGLATNDKGQNKAGNIPIMTDPQSGAVHKKIRNNDSPSKTNRFPISNDARIER
jgi:hypothetical protein